MYALELPGKSRGFAMTRTAEKQWQAMAQLHHNKYHRERNPIRYFNEIY